MLFLPSMLGIEDLCARIGISDPTLGRMESGNSRSSVGLYLSALYAVHA